ncbi:putative endo-1,3(4)-beta-glucanase 2 [Neolecta irregularis DAH-3]|uniref:glucan endo-1,3-beta-D-glucosidase n=1 Tax=Neolecta irregularis (strain DAH-3) TaxID=1198029 RepID=A0A1U7LJ41_NEOID|nr:putative endo-1,3(4)-beta-glucanase 2 [Neolecta irregularis DAH-3]|eukprot:OLL22613.1 putative endo-1,3(4)-beta-glucanase 2 [Neolecta irregularis DAH-3]
MSRSLVHSSARSLPLLAAKPLDDPTKAIAATLKIDPRDSIESVRSNLSALGDLSHLKFNCPHSTLHNSTRSPNITIPMQLDTIFQAVGFGNSNAFSIPAMSGINSAFVHDIFLPIAINNSLPQIPHQENFIKPRGLDGSQCHLPIQTNKFYGNLLSTNQSTPIWTNPYSLWWHPGGNGTAPGVDVAHIDENQKVFGKGNSSANAEYFFSPVGLTSLRFSAREFAANHCHLILDSPSQQSINMNIDANCGSLKLPLVQGMAFVTGIYSNLVPQFYSTFHIHSLTRVHSAPESFKYLVHLNDSKVWAVYIFPNAGTFRIDFNLHIINNSFIEASCEFSGVIQIAKIPITHTGHFLNTECVEQAVYDFHAGSYPTGVTLSGCVGGSSGSYSFNYVVCSLRGAPVLTYLFPHHVASITEGLKTPLQLVSTVRGTMTAFFGNRLTFTETDLPVYVGFMPYSPKRPFACYSDLQLQSIAAAAAKEAARDVVNESNLQSMYFSGKVLQKYALVCLVVSSIMNNKDLTDKLLANLKAAFARFSQNVQQHPLVYDITWKGISSSAGIKDGTIQDFGNSQFNDHHFHYGYFVHTAAIIGHLDPTWISDNKDYVNNLIRDVANPSTSDIHFPQFRSFDWFAGHSWAAGITPRGDGKDEESSSEDYNFYYGMKLWGHVTGDEVMEARANLMLAIQKRSMNSYMLLGSTNKIEPKSFVMNYVSGILLENKLNYTTYFSGLEQCILGIHMLPTTGISGYIRSAEFVRHEWNDKVASLISSVADGWKGILYLDYAIAEPAAAYDFFANRAFNLSFLDDGMSLTWSLAYSASLA